MEEFIYDLLYYPARSAEGGAMTKKRGFWLCVFLCLTAATIVIQTTSQGFSFAGFVRCCRNSNGLLLLAAFAAMLGIICCEGESLRMICGHLGYRRPFHHGLVFCAADLFFSAITPSSSGGQPVSAYCMYTDDIPMEVASVALLLNLIMYEAALFLVTLICVLIKPALFLAFPVGAKVFVLAGAVIQGALSVLLILLLFRPRLVRTMANACISLLTRIHLMHNAEEKRKRLEFWLERYAACAHSVRGNAPMMLKALALNVGQRVCMLLVSALVFLALGGRPHAALNVFIGQSYVYLGSNAVPLPGAVGAADWLFVSICGEFFPEPVSFNLLSRGISFYCNVAICGLMTWAWLLHHKKKKTA